MTGTAQVASCGENARPWYHQFVRTDYFSLSTGEKVAATGCWDAKKLRHEVVTEHPVHDLIIVELAPSIYTARYAEKKYDAVFRKQGSWGGAVYIGGERLFFSVDVRFAAETGEVIKQDCKPPAWLTLDWLKSNGFILEDNKNG